MREQHLDLPAFASRLFERGANSLDPQRAWLIVATASTLAGNFTLVGSAANLIVAQRAQTRGVTIGFWAYFKVGAPLTLLTISFGAWWL